MSNEEMFQQFLAVAERANRSGRPAQAIIGTLEMVKSVVVAKTVTIINDGPSPILVPRPPKPPGC